MFNTNKNICINFVKLADEEHVIVLMSPEDENIIINVLYFSNDENIIIVLYFSNDGNIFFFVKLA